MSDLVRHHHSNSRTARRLLAFGVLGLALHFLADHWGPPAAPLALAASKPGAT